MKDGFQKPVRPFLRAAVFATMLFSIALAPRASGQETLAARIQKVMERPEFARANFGVEFLDLATGKILYSHDANKIGRASCRERV